MKATTEKQLRTNIGKLLIVSHFFLIFLVVFMTAFLGKFTPGQLFTTLGLMLPLFTAYTTAIVATFLAAKNSPTDSVLVDESKVFVAYFIPSLFILFILFSIIWKAFGTLDFEPFTAMLGVSETAFGVYIGMIVKNLFDGYNPETTDGQGNADAIVDNE